MLLCGVSSLAARESFRLGLANELGGRLRESSRHRLIEGRAEAKEGCQCEEDPRTWPEQELGEPADRVRKSGQHFRKARKLEV